MRRVVSGAISDVWWNAFGALGLSHERWASLPKTGSCGSPGLTPFALYA